MKQQSQQVKMPDTHNDLCCRATAPKKIQLRRDWPWFVTFRPPYQDKPRCAVLQAGSIGEYFEHTDCYTWPRVEGWVPSIDRTVLARFPGWFFAIVPDEEKLTADS
jgi:hypothetical protein